MYQWRKQKATGDVVIVRYADDAVPGFQHQGDAERFLEQVRERLRKFGLELHPEKTRLIEFGRYAAERRKKRGEGNPETFNFPGFTPICGTSRKTGCFTVGRKTIGKRRAAKLKAIQTELRQRMHEAIGNTGKAFRKDVLRLWLRRLRPDVLNSNHHGDRFANQIRGLIRLDIDLTLAENRNRHHSDQPHKSWL